MIPVASNFTSNGISDSICNLFFKSDNPLRFGLVLRGKCINQKKLNVKTLPVDGIKWALQSNTPLKLPSGRAEVTTVGSFLTTLSYAMDNIDLISKLASIL